MITKTYEWRDELPDGDPRGNEERPRDVPERGSGDGAGAAGNGERRGRAYPAFSWSASPVYSEDMPDEIANSG
jgi:hypothetical protein